MPLEVGVYVHEAVRPADVLRHETFECPNGGVATLARVHPHRSLAAKTHIVAMNAEMDATTGAVVKQKADAAGVMYSNADGDEAGV